MTEKEIMQNAFDLIPEVSVKYATYLGDIDDRVHELMSRKGLTIQDLANIMDIDVYELDKWFTTIYPLTIRNIAQLEVALDEKIIYIY